MRNFEELSIEINVEEFKTDYCVNYLSNLKLREKFKITSAEIRLLTARLDLCRDSDIRKAKLQIVSKEDLENFYLTANNNKEQTARHFNLSMHRLSQLLKEYNICKNSDTILELRKKTCLEKYGVENASSAQAVKEKTLKTNLEKYGAKTFTSTAEAKKLVKATKLKNYGSENYNNIDKVKETKLLKYGDDKYNNRDKAKQTFLEHYGVDNYRKSEQAKRDKQSYIIEMNNYSQLFANIFDDRDKAISFLSDKKYTFSELAELFNCPNYTVSMWAARLNIADKIKHNGGKSSYEDEIIDYLKSINVNNIIHGSRKYLSNGLEIDIYLPDYKIGIEFNGNYWHSDAFLSNKYHQEKSILAQKQGIRLIHIYEYDWLDQQKQLIIKSILKIACNKIDNKIYARNCIIKKVKSSDLKSFCDANHIQGYRNAKVTYALCYNDEIVQMMSFSHHKEYEWEIIRSCTKLNTQVIGGVNKLFKAFIRDQKPNQVFSYCDFNLFNGVSYEKIGMQYIGLTAPNLHYILKNGKVINRMPHRYKELKSEIKASIYGSGSKKYLIQF